MLQNRTNREENKAVCIKPLHSLEDKKELPISRKNLLQIEFKIKKTKIRMQKRYCIELTQYLFETYFFYKGKECDGYSCSVAD